MTARILKNVLVLIADDVPDNTGESLVASELSIHPTEVWVTMDYSRDPRQFLGTALLRLEGDRLYADITIFDFVEGPMTLYPGVGGSSASRGEEVVTPERTFWRRRGVTIDEIGLHVGPNVDPRIPTITIPARPVLEDAPAPGTDVSA